MKNKTGSLRIIARKSSHLFGKTFHAHLHYIYIIGNWEKKKRKKTLWASSVLMVTGKQTHGFCSLWLFFLGGTPTLGLWIVLVLHVSAAALISQGDQFCHNKLSVHLKSGESDEGKKKKKNDRPVWGNEVLSTWWLLAGRGNNASMCFTYR